MATGKVHPPKKAYQQLKSVATSKLDQLKKNLQLQLKSVKFHNTTETERCLNRSEELCLGLLMDLLIQLFSPPRLLSLHLCISIMCPWMGRGTTSVLHKNTIQCSLPGLDPGLLDLELVHCSVTPSLKFTSTHICTRMGRGTTSVLRKNTIQCPIPGLDPGLLDLELKRHSTLMVSSKIAEAKYQRC